MTDEEKARELAEYFAGETDYKESAAYSSSMAMAEWKDEQHKQELIRIYNFVSPYLTPEANNDLKIIIGIC